MRRERVSDRIEILLEPLGRIEDYVESFYSLQLCIIIIYTELELFRRESRKSNYSVRMHRRRDWIVLGNVT